jgi:hypothetical protein
MPDLAAYIPLLKTELANEVIPNSLGILIYIAPIALMLFLANIAWNLWMRYIQADFYNSLKYAVLELRLPKETTKSPKAMEVVLTALHNTSDGGWTTKYWKGEYRPYFSLELVSIEGIVKFFIWTEDRRKGSVMSALYSQFPGIEVIEREDYTQGVTFDPDKMKLWAAEFAFTHKNPAMPIRTYVDYGLDKDPKEEFKVDPITSFIEFLNSVPPNQQHWTQILIRAHKGEQKKPGFLFKKYDEWQDAGEKLINELLARDPKTKVSGAGLGTGKVWKAGDPHVPVKTTPVEDEVLTSLMRSLTKIPFDVGIRSIYMAPKDTFNTPFGIGGTISAFKQFSSQHLNGLKPVGDKWIVQFDEPWKDYKDWRRNHLSKEALKAYKRRSYFFPPYKSKPLVMNAEELATIYHFPGSVAASPGLERIPSKKAEAPGNLPV